MTLHSSPKKEEKTGILCEQPPPIFTSIELEHLHKSLRRHSFSFTDDCYHSNCVEFSRKVVLTSSPLRCKTTEPTHFSINQRNSAKLEIVGADTFTLPTNMKKKRTKPSPYQTLLDQLKKINDAVELIEKMAQEISLITRRKTDTLDNWREILVKLMDHIQSSVVPLEVTNRDTQDEKSPPLTTLAPGVTLERLSSAIDCITFIVTRCEERHNFPNTKPFNDVLSLAIEDSKLRLATLHLISRLVKRPLITRRNQEELALHPALQSRLFTIAQGWSGRELGLDIITCCKPNLRRTIPLHLEYFEAGKGKQCLHIEDMSVYSESTMECFNVINAKYAVPGKYHFPLFLRILYSKQFPNDQGRTDVLLGRLTAFHIISLTANEPNMNMMSLFTRGDPELLPELVQVVYTEENIPDSIRTIAFKIFKSITLDDQRLNAVYHALGCGIYHGPLPSLVRRIAAAYMSDTDDGLMSEKTVSALFSLLVSIASTQSGSPRIVSYLLPLISHQVKNPSPVKSTILRKSIEVIDTHIYYDEQGAFQENFRELGGVDALLSRLVKETIGSVENDSSKMEEDSTELPTLTKEKKGLVKALMLAVSPCLVGQLNSVIEGGLADVLIYIFKHPQYYGGSIFSAAAGALATIINNEPTSFTALFNKGVPQAYLEAISRDFYPSSKTVDSLINTVSTICLNAEGRSQIQKLNFFDKVFATFADERHVEAIQSSSLRLGQSMEEFIRHYPEFKPIVIGCIIKVMKGLVEKGRAAESTKQLWSFVDNILKFLQHLLASDHAEAFNKEGGLELLTDIFNLSGIPVEQMKEINYLLQILFLQAPSVSKVFVSNINHQFNQLDSLSQWRKGCQIIEDMESTKSVKEICNKIHSLVSTLGSLVRDRSHHEPDIFNEWGTEEGIRGRYSLGQLQRCILWNMSRTSLKKESSKAEEKETTATIPPVTTSHSMDDPPAAPAPPPASQPENKRTSTEELALSLISGIHALAKGLSRYMWFISRHGSGRSSAHSKKRKTAENLDSHLGKILVEHLSWSPVGPLSVRERCAYLASVIGEVRSLMFNERVSHAHTLLLYSFHHNGGSDTLFHILADLVQTYRKEGKVLPAEDPISLALVATGKLIRCIVTHRMVNASLATMYLQGQPCYDTHKPFDSQALIQSIHTVSLKALLPLWNSEELRDLPANFVSQVSSSLVQIMQRETPAGTSHVPPPPPAPPAFTPDNNVVSALTDMGFTRSHALTALEHLGVNDLAVAADYMINHPQEEEGMQDAEDPELVMALQMSLGNNTPVANVVPPVAVENHDGDLKKLKESLKNSLIKSLPDVADGQQAAGELIKNFCFNNREEGVSVAKEMVTKAVEALRSKEAKPERLSYFCEIIDQILRTGTREAREVVSQSALPSCIIDRIYNDPKTENYWEAGIKVLEYLSQIPTDIDPPSHEKEVLDSMLNVSDQMSAVRLCLKLMEDPKSTPRVLLLTSRLTRYHEAASAFVSEGGLTKLLNREAVLGPVDFAILHHVMEDEATLRTCMENEIRNVVPTKNKLRSLLAATAAVLHRNPKMYVQVATEILRSSNDVLTTVPPGQNETQMDTTATQTAPSTTTAPSTQGTPSRQNKKIPHHWKTITNELFNILSSTTETKKMKEKAIGIITDLLQTFPSFSQLVLRGPDSNFDFVHLLLDIFSGETPPAGVVERKTENQYLKGALSVLCGRTEGRKKVTTEIVSLLREKTKQLSLRQIKPSSVQLLVDLTFGLLTSRASAGVTSELTRMMMDQNIGQVLVGVIGGLDLNDPESADVVNSVLNPLGQLCKLPYDRRPLPQMVEPVGEGRESDSEDMDEEQPPREASDRPGVPTARRSTTEVAPVDRMAEDQTEPPEEFLEENANPPESVVFGDAPNRNNPPGVSIVVEGSDGPVRLSDLIPGLEQLFQVGNPSMQNSAIDIIQNLMGRVESDHSLTGLPMNPGNLRASAVGPLNAARWMDDGKRPGHEETSFAGQFEKLLSQRIPKKEEQGKLTKEKTTEAKPTPQPVAPSTTSQTATQPANSTGGLPGLDLASMISNAFSESLRPPQAPGSMDFGGTPVRSTNPFSFSFGQTTPPLPSVSTSTSTTTTTTTQSIPPGIDPAFWEALPESVRAELVSQQVGSTAPPPPSNENSLNPDFLAALPDDIRAEVLEQEQRDRERATREREAESADVSRAQDMDNASFLATLPPELRQEILMTQDDDFIASLPPLVRAEASALRDRSYNRRLHPSGLLGQLGGGLLGNLGHAGGPRPPGPPAPAPAGRAVLEDPESIRVLGKILHLQNAINRNLVSRLFLHLCNFESTRQVTLDMLMENLVNRSDKMEIESQIQPEQIGSRSLTKDIEQIEALTPPQKNLLGYPAGFSFTFTLAGQQSHNLTARKVLDLLTFLVKNSPKISNEFVNGGANPTRLDQLVQLVSQPMIFKHATQLDSILNLVVSIFKGGRTLSTMDESSRPPVPIMPPQNILGLISLYNLPTVTEAAFKHLKYILEQLSTLESNRSHAVEGLSSGAKEAAEVLQHQLVQLRDRLATSSQHPAAILAELSFNHKTGLLRRMRTLSSILNAKKDTEDKSNRMINFIHLEKLWDSLESIMNGLDSEENMGNSASLTLSPLLPIIEIFFIAHTEGTVGNANQVNKNEGPEHQRFLTFAEKYRKFLNEFIRQSPSVLEESFGALLTTPNLLDFENKRSYFRSQLNRERTEDRGESIRLHVQRDQVMTSSFYQLHNRTPDEMKGKLTVVFNGEEAIDAGGVSREWYTILAKEMFNPNYCLFTPTADSAFQPNKDSGINVDHLKYFKFVGRVIGKALYDNQLLDAHFTRSFYKHILGAPITFQDMEAIDPEYYRNLAWILDNDITDVLDLTFSCQTEEFGVVRTDDLKPNGRNIAVTNDNKKEYVHLITQHKMTTAIRQQIDNFLAGFHEIIKPNLVSIFTPAELELLVSGLPDIDTEDLRKNTEYKGFTQHSPAIQWFWQVVKEMNQEDKALLLQFVTGTSKVPLEGFKALQGMSGPTKFSIHKDYETHRLPSAHTCFNQLDLPEYATYEEMKKNLYIAVRMGSAGFGIIKRSGAVEACGAHNPKVVGSKPTFAILFVLAVSYSST
ncbi:ubiquitin-protein ligase, UPL1 [Planoprotostelium fungivorum]|uniref:HECT-type E3 ubiquitin transferase n=1 Tax=Planoprotostelium fungivorum TaxID=1890364 RepID=A0A2P6NSK8_9EUKA|nr:ubiquitin-protein ligase, UPL1 [Planoprotostelium fungivorum]